MAKDGKTKKRFFKDFKAELKKVIWPTPKQLVNNTVAVLIIVVITAAVVFVLDIVFDLFNKYGINKLKEQVKGTATSNVVEENTTTGNEIVPDNSTVENEIVEE